MTTIPRPSPNCPAADRFEAIVRLCAGKGCSNPILAAAAQTPQAYAAYREAFIMPPSTAAKPSPAPNNEVRVFDKLMLNAAPDKRAARLAKLATESPAIYNAARAAGRF
jgi:hypothetical protein